VFVHPTNYGIGQAVSNGSFPRPVAPAAAAKKIQLVEDFKIVITA
jgi:hypothetical protein